jgi:hypothetical protein
VAACHGQPFRVNPLDDDDLHALARELRRTLRAHAPGFDDANAGDPGVTVLELLADLLEAIPNTSDARRAARVAALSRLAACIAAARVPDPCARYTLRRVHYFNGRLLTVDDFATEQRYVIARRRLHNRALHGWGVVQGLEVSSEGNGTRVSVSPGVALTPTGDELVVTAPLSCDVCADGNDLYVLLAHVERASGAMPGAAWDGDVDDPAAPLQQAAWIEEGVAVRFGDANGEDAVPLARLMRTADGYALDLGFAPPRPGAA